VRVAFALGRSLGAVYLLRIVRMKEGASMRFRPQHDHEQPPTPGAATRRLEAFSDAVFAIAITLLALNLHVPDLTTITPHAVAAALAAMWPTYLSFLLSFLTLLIAWVYHHRLLEGATRAGTSLLFLNGILLLIVSAVPFPTALLGAYLTTPAVSVAAAVYAGYIGMLNFSYNVLWWEIVRRQTGYRGVFKGTFDLLWGKITRHRNPRPGWCPPTSMVLSYLALPCYVIAVVIAFWSPIATLIICGVWWVVFTVRAPMLEAEQ
jgi:uncharacterized membrane protein